MPGIGVLSPAGSWQQAAVSLIDDSSKVMKSRPSRWKASDRMMVGTHLARNASAAMRSPSLVPFAFLPLQGVPSWPSLQRLGVIQEKFGVVATDFRSSARGGSATTCDSHRPGTSRIEWKYTKGL